MLQTRCRAEALFISNRAKKANKLHVACSKGNADETERLLEAELTSLQLLAKDSSGDTALHNAIRNGNNYYLYMTKLGTTSTLFKSGIGQLLIFYLLSFSHSWNSITHLFLGNIACAMIFLNHPNLNIAEDLGRELLRLCDPSMTTVRDFIERKGSVQYK